MKKLYNLLTLIIFGLLSSLSALAQSSASSTGRIVLYPYVESAPGAPTSKADRILLHKLRNIVLANGLADSGYNPRFIITAHPVVIDKETTATVPQKTVVNFNLSIYVGDAVDGKLFGSYTVELRGIGNTLDEAFASGYKSFNPDKYSDLNLMIERAKLRILRYYNDNSSALLSKAKASASSGNYAECYDLLLQIPQGADAYDHAQDMLVSYRSSELDNANKSLLDRARAAYSAAPNEEGAEEARRLLEQISCPSSHIRNEMTTLNKEIASRLKAVEDAERAAERAERAAERAAEATAEANAHAERLATINGAAKVAAAYAQRPVYNVHLWGWW